MLQVQPTTRSGANVLRIAVLSTRAAHFLAFFLLIASGTTFRILSGESEAGASDAIQTNSLARLPIRLGQWNGENLELDQAVIAAAQVDDHLYRRYVRTDGAAITLFVAGGSRPRDLMPHRPEVCYPSAGWIVRGSSEGVIDLGEALLPNRVLNFGRGGLSPVRTQVLNYYVVDGRFCADVSAVRSWHWRGRGNIRRVYQVQISILPAPGMSTTESESVLRDFARSSAIGIRDIGAGGLESPITP